MTPIRSSHDASITVKKMAEWYGKPAQMLAMWQFPTTKKKALTESLKHPWIFPFYGKEGKSLCFWKSEWSGASALSSVVSSHPTVTPEVQMSWTTGWR